MNRKSCLIIAVTVVLFPSASPECANASQIQPPAAQTSRDSDAKVTAIMNGILKRGEGHVEDVIVNTWVPPNPDDLQRIREIGSDAIPPLDKAVDCRLPFHQLLAVRLLAAIGGPNIVPPLKRALEPDKPNSVRMASLAALRSVPDDLALPIIRRTVFDPDPLVAQRARELLTEYYKVPEPETVLKIINRRSIGLDN